MKRLIFAAVLLVAGCDTILSPDMAEARQTVCMALVQGVWDAAELRWAVDYLNAADVAEVACKAAEDSLTVGSVVVDVADAEALLDG